MTAAVAPAARSPDEWRAALLRLIAVEVALLVLFAGDVGDLIRLWTSDKTYNHCLLIAPIAAVLVWLRRRELAQLTPGRWAAPLLWVAAATLLWLLGSLAGVAQARQLAFVALLQGAAAVCLGRQLTRALAFPLAFLFFLVPFGAELVPPLQQFTARMALGLLHATGIAAALDGVFLTTSAGWFEVAEACSGISFLIATLAWGTLVANLLFVTPWRRIAFVAACAVLPVLANGLRAWATVAAAQWVGLDRASGFDHIVYGWIFFALVLALLLGLGWRYFERAVDDPTFDARRLARLRPGGAGPSAVMATVGLPLAAVVWSALALAAGDRPMPGTVTLPRVPGWTRVAADPAVPPWTPRYDGADHYLSGSYRDAAGRTVEVAVVLYRSQAEGREVSGYGQGPIPPDGDWAWSRDLPAPPGAAGVRMLGMARTGRSAWTWTVVDGRSSGNPLTVKARTLAARLRLADPAAAALIVSAAGEESAAQAAMASFLQAYGAPERRIHRLIAQARGN